MGQIIVGSYMKSQKRKNKPFGFQKTPVYLECFIWKSEASDGHCVYLGIGRENGTFEHWRIHTFSNVVKAWDYSCKVRELLRAFRYHSGQKNDQIVLSFLDVIEKTYPDVEHNDGKYEVTGDPDIIKLWEATGNFYGVDTPPPGVNVVCIQPLVFTKYKVLPIEAPKDLQKAMVADINSKCGNPNGYFIYTIGESLDKPFGDSNPIFNSYVTAAYVADYVNDRKKELLTSEELNNLLVEANILQGKLPKGYTKKIQQVQYLSEFER